MSDKSLEKDWTKGSVIGNLLQLSWPMVSVEVLYAVVVVVELIWIGRLGPVSIAGVGLVDLFIIPIMSVDMGIIFGSRAMIARYAGAGDTKRVGIAVGQSILLGFFWGAFMTVVGVLLAERILSMFGSASEVVAQGAQYMRVFFAGLIGLEVLEMGQYAIQSSGDTTRPMIIELVTRFIHLTLCPFLVLGWWVFPMLGVGGAAMSQVIANGIGAVIVLWVLFSGRTRVRLTLSDLRPVPDIMWRILKVGIPSILMMLQRSIGSIVLMRIIVPFGTLAMSSHSLVLRLEAFIFAFCFGLGGGTGVMVGQNLGANQPKRAERSMWTGAGTATAIMVIFSAVILLWTENIVGLFTADPELVRMGSAFLKIATAGYVMVAFVFVLRDGISGAGDTLPVMIVSIVMVWVVELPLAFLLPRFTNLDIYGVRWAIVAGIFLGAILYVAYFMRGKWKSKKV